MFLIRFFFPIFRFSESKAAGQITEWLKQKDSKNSATVTDFIPYLDALTYQQFRADLSKRLALPETELDGFRSVERSKILYRPVLILFVFGFICLGINLFLEILPYLGSSRLEKPFVENLLSSGGTELVERQGSFCRYIVNTASEIAEDYFYIGWYLFSIGSILTFLGSVMDAKYHSTLKIALPFIGLFTLSIAWKVFDNSKLAGLTSGRSMIHYTSGKSDADRKCMEEWANLRQGITAMIPSGGDSGDIDTK